MSNNNHQQGSEHHSHHGEHKPPHSGVEFFIEVDDKNITFTQRYATGKEIMSAAHVDPESHDLWQKMVGGGKKLIGPNDQVDLLEDGIEHFITVPKKRTDGREAGHMPPLTDKDRGFLTKLPYEWEVEQWQGNLLLKIKKWPIPPGYNHSFVDIAIVVPITYPSAQLDMFYVLPGLFRIDGKSIPNLADENFNGTTWQRWSRHRLNPNDWRMGIDCVETHLCLMDSCLIAELGR